MNRNRRSRRGNSSTFFVGVKKVEIQDENIKKISLKRKNMNNIINKLFQRIIKKKIIKNICNLLVKKLKKTL